MSRPPGNREIAIQIARRFLVTGRVQGVYFRQSTRAEASRLGIRGMARNLPDGSVEVIARGTQAAVEELHRWLRRGPPMANVAEVRVFESETECAADGETPRDADSFTVA